MKLVRGEDLSDYRRFSKRVFEVLRSFGAPVERLGMDENFVDATKLVEGRLLHLRPRRAFPVR